MFSGIAGSLDAQRVVVTGRLLDGGPDGKPLAGAWAVLHQVTMGGGGGPIDSARSDARGTYALRIPRVDSTAIYVVSTWSRGIAYFSEPIRVLGRPAATVQPLAVYDTSSAGPGIRVARRLLTIARPKQDGARHVLEILELVNPGRATRIANDTTRPTWQGAIPSQAIQFQVGQGDLSPPAVARRGDSVAVFGPIPPGPSKQLSYAYVLPADVRLVTVPIDQWTGELDLLLEDSAAVVAPGLESLGAQDVETRRFERYRTRALEPAARVTIALPSAAFRVQALVPAVVGLVALALGLGFVVALRRRPPSVVPSPSDDG